MIEIVENDEGKWEVINNIWLLVEPSQKWIDAHQLIESEPQPPSEIEQLRLEIARGNAELFEMIILSGGGF